MLIFITGNDRILLVGFNKNIDVQFYSNIGLPYSNTSPELYLPCNVNDFETLEEISLNVFKRAIVFERYEWMF